MNRSGGIEIIPEVYRKLCAAKITAIYTIILYVLYGYHSNRREWG
jgi:hypothetical protein